MARLQKIYADYKLNNSVRNEDDFDYACEFEHPTPELIHEVINWMLDHEYATISDMDDVIKMVDAFQKRPVIKRKRH